MKKINLIMLLSLLLLASCRLFEADIPPYGYGAIGLYSDKRDGEPARLLFSFELQNRSQQPIQSIELELRLYQTVSGKKDAVFNGQVRTTMSCLVDASASGLLELDLSQSLLTTDYANCLVDGVCINSVWFADGSQWKDQFKRHMLAQSFPAKVIAKE